MDLVTLKKEYLVIEKKYKLPSFSEINAIFEIEKIEQDTENLARAVRKFMIDKVLNTLSFIEMLIQQVNAPRLYQNYLRTIPVKDKESLQKIYEKLGELSLLSLVLEVDTNEKKECDAIVKFYETWKSIKPALLLILESIQRPATQEAKKEKSYFG